MDKESFKNWSEARKSALVAQIVSGKLSVKAACQRHELSPQVIQEWVRVFRRTTLHAFDERLRQTFLIQGADAGSLGGAEYTGTLEDIPISDLIQTFQMGGKDGVISITRGAQRSQIWCSKGEIVDAESGRLRGEAAAYRVLGFDSGQVLADFRYEPRTRVIDVPGSVLLLEAARRKDESARLLERLGDSRTLYRPGAPGESASAAELALLRLFEGGRRVEEVLEHGELGDLETLSAIVRLVERERLVADGLAPGQRPAASLPVAHAASSARVSSFLPLVTSQHPESVSVRRSPLLFAGAGVALGTCLWLAFSVVTEGSPWSPLRSWSAAAPPSAAPPVPQTYPLESSAEPAQAEFWLDGVKLGVGHIRRDLPRDGATHSLRVVADGHAPTTLLFADAPPPRHIVLEKLDAAPPASPPPPAGAGPGGATPNGSGPKGVRPSGARLKDTAPKGLVPGAASKPEVPNGAAPRDTPPRGAASGTAVPRNAAPSGAPNVQRETPVIQLLE